MDPTGHYQYLTMMLGLTVADPETMKFTSGIWKQSETYAEVYRQAQDQKLPQELQEIYDRVTPTALTPRALIGLAADPTPNPQRAVAVINLTPPMTRTKTDTGESNTIMDQLTKVNPVFFPPAENQDETPEFLPLVIDSIGNTDGEIATTK